MLKRFYLSIFSTFLGLGVFVSPALAATFSLQSPQTIINQDCEYSNSNCQYSDTAVFLNTSGQALHNVTVYTGHGHLQYLSPATGAWTTDQTTMSMDLENGQSVSVPFQITGRANSPTDTWYDYLYVDGQICNSGVNDCYYAGAASLTVITHMTTAPTQTPLPTATVVPTSTPIPTATPTPITVVDNVYDNDVEITPTVTPAPTATPTTKGVSSVNKATTVQPTPTTYIAEKNTSNTYENPSPNVDTPTVTPDSSLAQKLVNKIFNSNDPKVNADLNLPQSQEVSPTPIQTDTSTPTAELKSDDTNAKSGNWVQSFFQQIMVYKQSLLDFLFGS